MLDGDKLLAKVTLSWKKSFSLGVVILHKLRNCNERKKASLCDNFDKLVNQNSKLWQNLINLNDKLQMNLVIGSLFIKREEKNELSDKLFEIFCFEKMEIRNEKCLIVVNE